MDHCYKYLSYPLLDFHGLYKCPDCGNAYETMSQVINHMERECGAAREPPGQYYKK